VRDGRLLAGSAVSMAMNLRLGQASTYARSLVESRQGDVGPSDDKAGDLDEALVKSRLVCSYRRLSEVFAINISFKWLSLANAESM
jgi:hypothetical protein